jgi:predicted amidohydrolase YtcJ
MGRVVPSAGEVSLKQKSSGVGVAEAVAGFTAGAAHAEFEESQKGTLEPGKLADIVLLDRDVFAIPPEEIRKARVMMTIAGGRIVFER